MARDAAGALVTVAAARPPQRTHLAHIFTKLDVSNRTQLAALITRTNTEGTPGISVVPK